MTGITQLATSVRLETRGRVAIVAIDRPEKRNALDMETVQALGRFFEAPPADIGAAVLTSSGDHFSAGVDLAEFGDMTVFENVHHSRSWHRVFEAMEYGTLPVFASLRGAVIGGGLELALATHVRIAEPSTFYALPEGTRGIFVGGGASVRLPRVIGVAHMADMMLTGRVHDAESGHRLGISQYLVDDGEGLERAIELATMAADNAPATNFAILQALPRIAEMSVSDGLLAESLMASIAGGTEEAKQRVRDFLAGRAAKVAAETATSPDATDTTG